MTAIPGVDSVDLGNTPLNPPFGTGRLYWSMSDSVKTPPAAGSKGFFSRTFSSLGYRDFRILWLGALTSTTGTWMQQVAQAWLVLDLTGSVFYLGLTGFLAQLPHVLFSLIGGAFADRFERRKQLLFSQYVQMSSAAVLTLLVATGWVQIWHFLVLVFVTGTGQAFGGPAYQALIPSLVRREDVPNAIALNSIQFNLSRVFGPLLSGVVLATLGAALCFALNGLSFLAVIVTLHMIRTRFVPRKPTDGVWRQIARGFVYIRDQGALWQLTILGFVSTFCGVPLITLLPAIARDTFGVSEVGYARMMAVSGAGAVTGALLYASQARRARGGLFTLRAQLTFALILGAFALSENLLLSCLLLFLAGVSLIALFASITSLVQLALADEMRGRVMSIFYLAFRGGMPLGDLLSSIVASQSSPSLALLLLALILALVAGGFLAFGRGVRGL